MMTTRAIRREAAQSLAIGRPTIGPARACCRLTMEINGVAYGVEPNPPETYDIIKAYRLRKDDGTAYDVASTDFGLTCDCPDFVFRRDGVDPGGCKHLKAVVAYGLLDGYGKE